MAMMRERTNQERITRFDVGTLEMLVDDRELLLF